MAPILVRVQVTLPAPANGAQLQIGSTVWVEADDPFVATQLSVGHLVPVGPIPRLDPDESDD